MDTQFIKFKTACLAKQAGFDWEVQTYYNVPEYGDIGFRADWQIADNHNAVIGRISAPTQAVLQRWLKEEEYIIVSVDSDAYFERECYFCEIWNSPVFKAHRIKDDDGNVMYFNTYEAALEAGLQKCLTMIIRNNGTTTLFQ